MTKRLALLLGLAAMMLATARVGSTPAAGADETPAPKPAPATRPSSWAADNGNGTYSNPLFYEEFSDPDVIRVDKDYYLAGTTMHANPGLIVLHSKDLVNWELSSYCIDRLNLGPVFRLEGGEMYGQGVWAPCIRYNKGTFYIFSNINGQGTHVFSSKDPKGPWKHDKLATPLYDLGVLFDDDGRVYAVTGAHEISLTELKPDISDVVPNSKHVIIKTEQGMGEGLHFYKIKGKYYIVSAIPGAHTDMVVARADKLDGPWTVERMVQSESLGTPTQNGLRTTGRAPNQTFAAAPSDPNVQGGLTIHQGGIVDTPSGQWWSIIMQDHGSVGRLSCLVPITWDKDFPIIGLPGNLRKAPNTWIKPDTGVQQDPKALFVRSDNFDGDKLSDIWQWNHVPEDTKWSLTEKPGVLRLHSLAAADFWMAKNTLTQRAIGPESTVTVEVDSAGMKTGDIAGLALLNQPYAWMGLAKTETGLDLRAFDQISKDTITQAATAPHLWLRAACNFDTEKAIFSWSADGKTFTKIADPFPTIYQLKTFQGIRYSLFNYNTAGGPGGYADFDNFKVDEPRANPGAKAIPLGKKIVITNEADNRPVVIENGALVSFSGAVDMGGAFATPAMNFRFIDRGLGRVALQVDGVFLSVSADASTVTAKTIDAAKLTDAETFQWVDMHNNDFMLMSLTNHRYLIAPAKPGPVAANGTGPKPDHKEGSCFFFKVME